MNKITTHSTQEFMEICERAKAGEFNIDHISRGKRNGVWVFSVYKPVRQVKYEQHNVNRNG